MEAEEAATPEYTTQFDHHRRGGGIHITTAIAHILEIVMAAREPVLCKLPSKA